MKMRFILGRAGSGKTYKIFNEIKERLKDFMIGKKFTDLPTIDFEDKILIEALNFETDEFEIYDYIIDKKFNIISNYLGMGFTEWKQTIYIQ